jgi:hypothetical protein
MNNWEVMRETKQKLQLDMLDFEWIKTTVNISNNSKVSKKIKQ